MAHSSTPSSSLIYSELAQQDQDFAEIVEIFVAGLPERVQAIRQALDQSDWDTLKRLAHQLKGSGGGHGYPMLTEQAATLEQKIKQNILSDLQRDVNELTDLISRIRVLPS